MERETKQPATDLLALADRYAAHGERIAVNAIAGSTVEGPLVKISAACFIVATGLRDRHEKISQEAIDGGPLPR